MLVTNVNEISLVDDNSIVIPILSSNKLCILFLKEN